MVRVIVGHMYSNWSDKYSWDEEKSRPDVRKKCEGFMQKGYDVKFTDDGNGKRLFYIEFADDTEAVMFKLTQL